MVVSRVAPEMELLVSENQTRSFHAPRAGTGSNVRCRPIRRLGLPINPSAGYGKARNKQVWGLDENRLRGYQEIVGFANSLKNLSRAIHLNRKPEVTPEPGWNDDCL